ncbi:MAG: hypothetical protein Q9202_003486 [Teloschistes flavicans]
MPEEVSHGRGGAGNINPDSTPYTDGEIVREGPAGDQGDGPYSSGVRLANRFVLRGGAGNIDSPRVKATQAGGQPGDADIVPETALRDPGAGHENYHIGRGGGGNVHKEHDEKTDEHHEGLGDKLKHKILGKKE